MANKSSGSISVSLFKIVFIFIGIGVFLGGLYAIAAMLSGSLDNRTQAGFVGQTNRLLLGHPCNLTFKPPVNCASGYHCTDYQIPVGRTMSGSRESFARWGKCVPDAGPTSIPVPVQQMLCYNQVFNLNGQLSWPDACRGKLQSGMACAEMVTPLTAGEITGYNAWVESGKPAINGCNGNPIPVPTLTVIHECWNDVVNSGTGYTWTNVSCTHQPELTAECANRTVRSLTTAEVQQYTGWVQSGKPAIAGCGQAE
jgi:hypothetical protein